MILHDEDVRGTRFFRGVWLALLVSSLCLCTGAIIMLAIVLAN